MPKTKQKTTRTLRNGPRSASTGRTSRSAGKPPQHVRLLPWKTIRLRCMAATHEGTLSAFARMLECHPNALRLAVLGKCPAVLRDMQARLGKLAA